MSIEVMSESNSGPETEEGRTPLTRTQLKERAHQTVGGELTEANIIQALHRPHQVEISPDAIVNLLTEIPTGKNSNELMGWVEERIRTAEKEGDFINPQFIQNFKEAIGNYDPLGGPPVGQTLTEFRSNLALKMETRGYLYFTENRLSAVDFKSFHEIFKQYFDKEHLKTIWEEELESNEKIIQWITHKMEEDDGVYWREVKQFVGIDPATGQPKFDYVGPTGAKHLEIQTHLATLPISGETRKLAQDITEKLFKVTGMASYYMGPVDNAGHLIDRVIMEEIDADPAGPLVPHAPPDVLTHPNAFPEVRYIKNERYWNRWWDLRRQGAIHMPIISDPEKGGAAKTDPSSLTRLMYLPEELNRLDTTKASSLRYAAETYLRTLPQINGHKTLEDYMNDPNKRVGAFRFSGAVEKVGELVGLMVNLMNEPIIGGENAGNTQRLDQSFKNLTTVMGKFGEYLHLGVSPNILYYATSRMVISVFSYVNGNSSDRRQEFRRLPKFHHSLINLIINSDFVRSLMDAAKLQETLRELQATNARVTTDSTVEQIRGLFVDFLKAMGGAFKK